MFKESDINNDNDPNQYHLIIKREQEEDIYIDFINITKASDILRILTHNIKKKILMLLSDEPDLTVTAIYTKMHLEQSLVSQHLSALKNAGILKAHRVGKHIRYSIDVDYLSKIYKHVVLMLA